MSCTIPAIENKYRQSNPELADKLNQQTFDTWNTLLDSKLFEEKDNELYVNKEGTKKRVKQDELIGSINNPTSKEGINFVFESNPELSLIGNQQQYSQYLDTIKSNVILPTDKIVFGHPTIGKSFLKNQGEDKFISLDDDYATEINTKVKEIADKYNVTTYQVKDGGTQKWNNEYNQMMQEMFNVAKQKAISENKTLFTSNTNLLKNNAESFDKIINLTDKEFERRIQERGAKYDIKEWKSQINEAISKLPTNKVINTNKYLSDLFLGSKQDIEGFKEFVKEQPQTKDIVQITEDNKVSVDVLRNDNTNQDIKYQLSKEQSEGIIASEKTIRDLAAKIADRIGMTVKFESDRSKDYKGKIENNVAYVNLAYATLDTPIHEILGHPIIRAIKNKELYQNLLKEFETGRGKEVLDRIKRDYVNKEITDYNYLKTHGTSIRHEKYTLEEQQEEAIVELLGLYTAEKLDKVKDGKLISLLKRLLKEMKQFVRSLLNQKEVEIDKLPDNMTINDLSDLLAYSNSKLILPGYEVEYTTPDNNKFKTYQEASNHISELAKSVKDVDLSNTQLPIRKKVEKANDIPVDKFTDEFDNTIYNRKEGKWFIEDTNRTMLDDDIVTLWNSNLSDNYIYKAGVEGFIEKNKEYEQSKEIIEEWKKVNNIQYNPEEIYSRGQGFYHSIGAYSNHDLELILQNILEHFKDNNLAGGTYDVSAFTKPTDKTIRHIEKSGVLIEIFPESKDINWASNIDVFSGSTLETHEKFSGSKLKKELAGVSESKYPSLSNINTIQPNLANIIDELNHDHNELGITLTGKNFRFAINEKVLNTDTPDGLYWKVKKLVDANNKILDQKYGKLVKPEISKKEKSNNLVYNVNFSSAGGEISANKNFSSLKEATDYIESIKEDLIGFGVGKVIPQKIYTQSGIQPTTTNETLKESIDSVRNKITKFENIEKYQKEYDDFSSKKENVLRFRPENYDSSFDNEYYVESLEQAKTKDWWVEDYFKVENVTEEFNSIRNKKAVKMKEDLDRYKKEYKDLTGKVYKSDYTIQALINTKIASLKEVAKKYPRSLIRSEVKPVKQARQPLSYFEDEIPFQKVPVQITEDNKVSVDVLRNEPEVQQLDSNFSPAQMSDTLKPMYQRLLELNNNDVNKTNQELLFSDRVIFEPAFDNVGLYYLKSEENPTFTALNGSLDNAKQALLKDKEVINNTPQQRTTSDLIQELESNRNISKTEQILNKLSSKFNIPWQWSTNPNERGSIRNGIVYINKDLFTEDTVFHEFAHPFVEYLSKNNQTIYKILATNSSKVINSKTGKTVKEEVESKYSDYSKEDLEKEIITEAIGLAAINQLTEQNKSAFQNILDKFLNFISKLFGFPVTLNTTYKDISNMLFDDNYTQDLSSYTLGNYFQRNNGMTRDEIEAKFTEYNSRFVLDEPTHKYKDTVTGEELDSVTTAIIKPLYKQLGWDNLSKNRNNQESYAIQAAFGTVEHNLIQSLIESNLNSDKSIKDDLDTIAIDDIKALNLHIIDIKQELDLESGKEAYQVQDVLKDQTINQTINFVNSYLQHIKDTYPGAHIFTEQKIYDSSFKTKKGDIKLIGTADIVIVLPDGSYFVNDWKSTSTQYGTQFGPVRKEALDNIKKQAYKEQLITYGKMIGGNFQGGTAYPIGANLSYDYQDGLSSPSNLEFPHPNPLKADPTNRVLYPVVVSGKEEIADTVEELVKNFRFLQDQIRNGKWLFNEDHSKYEQAKSIDRIIEDLETRRSLNTAIYEASLLMNEIRSLLNDMSLQEAENAQQQLDIYTQLSKYFRDFNLNDNDRNIAAGLQYNIEELSKDLDIKRSEILKEKGVENGISDLNTAEKKYGFLQRTFKGISTVTGVKTISLFYKMFSKMFNKADFNARKDLSLISDLETGLKEYGKRVNLNILTTYHKFLKKDKDGKPLPQLLQQVQDVYYETIAKALQESDLKVLNSHLDLLQYEKTLNEKVNKERARLESIYENINFSQEQIDNFRKKVNSEKDTDEELQKQMRIDTVNSRMNKFKDDRTLIKNGRVNPIAISNLFTISKDKSKAYAHTSIIKYSDKIQQFYTNEYKEVLNNPELNNFYEFMIAQNTKAVELGHIDFRQKYTFIPSVLASTLEKAERGDIGALKFESIRKQLDNSYVDEYTASTIKVNEITGERMYVIPKLYKNDLKSIKKDENGNDIVDYSNYSLDLGGIYALYSMELHNYEAKSTLAPYGDALINLEKTKKNLVTNKFNNVVLDVNGNSQKQDLKANVDFVESVILRDIYNITHATTNDLAMTIPIPVKKTDENGKTSIVLEKRTLSGNKALRGTIAFNSHTNLGLNFMSAAATFFGGSMNAFFESNRSSQFNKNDLKKSMRAVTSLFSKDSLGDKNLTLINLIDPMMENENLHRAVKLSSTKLRKIFNTAALYEMMRRADRAIQYGVTLSITNNYMVKNDQLININEYVRQTYKLNDKTYSELLTEGNITLINQARKEIAKLTEKTKEKDSIYAVSQMKGDNLDTPLTEDLAMQLRSIIRKQNAQIIGNMSQRDKIGAKNYILGGALMQYKNWMPSLLWQRFGNAEMDNDLGRLNWGKTRTFVSALHKDFFNILKSSFSDLDDISLGRIKTKYEQLKSEFVLNGGNESEFETLDNFTEYYLANFRSQLKELTALLSFMMLFSALAAALGWDDEDKKKDGYQKTSYRIYNKLISELTFFYSPTQLSGIIKNVLPVTSTLENVEKFGQKLVQESYYRSKQSLLGIDEHKHIDEITPTKHLFKMPVLKEVTTWMALFDDDFRKEYNITIQH